MFEKYAGFWKRLGAHVIDQLLLGFVRTIVLIPVWIYTIAGFIHEFDNEYSDDYVMVGDEFYSDMPLAEIFGFIIIVSLLSMVIDWLYYAIMESSSKQATLGKMALSIKVTDLDGNRISFGRATGRYFGKIISGLILMIGYIMAAFTEKKQALHDILAECVIINSVYLDQQQFNQQNNFMGEGYETRNY